MPETRRPSTRLMIIGAAVAVVVVVIIIVTATRDEGTGSSSPATTAPLVIQSPATVTGITGVTGVADAPAPSDGGATRSTTAEATNTYALVRTLTAAGTVDCATPAVWQPFAELQISFQVAQPAADTTCGGDVLDLPAGFCTASCPAVPADWRVVEQPGVSPQALMLIIAPLDASTNTAQFLCVKDFVPQPKQVLPVATSIDQACSATTSDSVEIPYVPPVTSDIPYVPPPASADIPTGTS